MVPLRERKFPIVKVSEETCPWSINTSITPGKAVESLKAIVQKICPEAKNIWHFCEDYPDNVPLHKTHKAFPSKVVFTSTTKEKTDETYTEYKFPVYLESGAEYIASVKGDRVLIQKRKIEKFSYCRKSDLYTPAEGDYSVSEDGYGGFSWAD